MASTLTVWLMRRNLMVPSRLMNVHLVSIRENNNQHECEMAAAEFRAKFKKDLSSSA